MVCENPGETRDNIVIDKKPKVLAGLSQKRGPCSGTRTLPFLVMGSHATGGKSAPNPFVVTKTVTWQTPYSLPQGKKRAQGKPIDVREWEMEEARHPVMGWIVEHTRNITPRESGPLTSVWPCLNQETLGNLSGEKADDGRGDTDWCTLRQASCSELQARMVKACQQHVLDVHHRVPQGAFAAELLEGNFHGAVLRGLSREQSRLATGIGGDVRKVTRPNLPSENSPKCENPPLYKTLQPTNSSK